MKNYYKANLAVDFIHDIKGYIYETAMDDGPSAIGDVYVIHCHDGYTEISVNIHDFIEDSISTIICELNIYTEYLVLNVFKSEYKRIVGQELKITNLIENK